MPTLLHLLNPSKPRYRLGRKRRMSPQAKRAFVLRMKRGKRNVAMRRGSWRPRNSARRLKGALKAAKLAGNTRSKIVSARKAAKSTKKVARRSAVKKRKNPMAKHRRRRATKAQVRARRKFVSKFAGKKHRRKNPGKKKSKGKARRAKKAVQFGPVHDPALAGKKYSKKSGKFYKPRKRRKKKVAKHGMSHAARVKAGKKAARTRKRNKAAKHGAKRGAHKKRRGSKKRRYGSRRRRYVASLTKKIHASTKVIRKKGKKTRARRLKRRVYRARRAALTLQRYSLKHKMPKGVRAKMRAFGIGRVNPSIKEIGKGLVELLPEMGAVAVSVGLVAWGGTKLGDMLVGTAEKPGVMAGSKMLPYLPIVSSGIVAVATYAALRMFGPKISPHLSKLAGPALLGGVAVASIHAMKTIMIGPEGAKVSLGSKVGLPIGDYTSVSGWRASLAGWNASAEGAYLGDYERAMVGGRGMGEYASMGSIFNGSSLGAVRQGALPGGREAGHGIDLLGRGGNEVTVEEFVDGGSLSGGIFD